MSLCQEDRAVLIYYCFRGARALSNYFLFSLVVLALWGGFAFAQSAFDDPGVRSSGKGKGGDLVSVNGKVDAGDIALGSSSQVVVLIRNDGARPITSSKISLYPSSNVSASVSLNECAKTPLPPGAVCAMAFSIKGLQPGKFRIEILMRHDGRAKLITSTISGFVDISTDSTR